jgi:hypothetical protein
MTDPIIEAMARQMWFDEAVNVTGRKRLIAWDEEQPAQQDRWRERATSAAYLAALPMIAEAHAKAATNAGAGLVGGGDGGTYVTGTAIDAANVIRALAAAKVEELSRGQ